MDSDLDYDAFVQSQQEDVAAPLDDTPTETTTATGTPEITAEPEPEVAEEPSPVEETASEDGTLTTLSE